MNLAGKYQDLRQWSETPEATGGQYPTLRQELDRPAKFKMQLKKSMLRTKEIIQERAKL